MAPRAAIDVLLNGVDVAWEGIYEGSVEFVLHEVLFVLAKEYRTKGGGVVKVVDKHGDSKVLWKFWREL